MESTVFYVGDSLIDYTEADDLPRERFLGWRTKDSDGDDAWLLIIGNQASHILLRDTATKLAQETHPDDISLTPLLERRAPIIAGDLAGKRIRTWASYGFNLVTANTYKDDVLEALDLIDPEWAKEKLLGRVREDAH